MIDNNNEKSIIFFNELKKEARRLASSYGFDIPDFVSIENKDCIAINLTAYKMDSSEYFRALYMERCQDIGMDPEWINSEFLSADKKRRFSIVGLDPDGGARCVRLRGDDGVFYHLSPSAVSFLIGSEQKIP